MKYEAAESVYVRNTTAGDDTYSFVDTFWGFEESALKMEGEVFFWNADVFPPSYTSLCMDLHGLLEG
jgi:hypothetical protein